MKQLQELFQKICAMSVKGRYALLAGCVGVIVLIDAVALMGLQLGLVSSTSKANKKIEDDVERVKADRERMVLMRQGLENSQTRLKEVGNKFRTIAEIPAVLEDISRIAVQQGVVIDQIKRS